MPMRRTSSISYAFSAAKVRAPNLEGRGSQHPDRPYAAQLETLKTTSFLDRYSMSQVIAANLVLSVGSICCGRSRSQEWISS